MSSSIDNSTDIDKGATVAFTHLDPLKTGSDRGAEIQSMISTNFVAANNSAKMIKLLITMHSLLTNLLLLCTLLI